MPVLLRLGRSFLPMVRYLHGPYDISGSDSQRQFEVMGCGRIENYTYGFPWYSTSRDCRASDEMIRAEEGGPETG